MSKFIELDAKSPATMEAVVEAVIQLSRFDEAQLLELVSAGRLREVFPFRPQAIDDVPSDFVSEDELVEASAAPLDRNRQAALIQSSMPFSQEPQSASDIVRNKPKASKA